MLYAWMLVMWMGTPVIVPGISTEAECRRLAQEIGPPKTNAWSGQTRCINYSIAHR